jgi:uncharacterized membrane protein YjfL (UPF0719 family)
MNTNLLFLSVIHLAMAIFVGVLGLYFSYLFTNRVFRKKGFKIEINNIAFGIYMGSTMLSMGIVVSAAFSPSMSLLKILQKTSETTLSLFGNFTLYFLLFIAISMLISYIIIIVSTTFYSFLTKEIKEYTEIGQNNISIAIIMGVILIVIALFAKDSVTMIIESIIPYPKIGIIN